LATYQELKAQMAALEQQTEAARLAEFQAVLEDIRAKVVVYGITERDIFGRRRPRSQGRAAGSSPVKYLDPKTGATWSGRGRAPNWIKDVKNRDRFLVKD
jgi:DNA-binding protein H-NS